MTIKATFQDFKLTAKYLGDKQSPFNDYNYNNHRVTVTGPEGRCSFEFWSSIMHPEITKTKEVIEAFQCFVSDAISGTESFEEFCSSLGYDNDSRTAERVYKACQRATKKLERVWLGDLFSLSNDLNDLESESCNS